MVVSQNSQGRDIVNFIKKIFTSVALGVGALTITATTATASVSQGDIIYSDDTQCTIGYVDGHAAYSAAHCARNGAIARDHAGNHVGVWRHEGDPSSPHTDIARIDLYQHSGGNGYSGNKKAPDWALLPGSSVCKQGVTTGVTCGLIVARNGNTVQTVGAVPYPGDSSGPAWVPGQGYIGVATQNWTGGSVPDRGVYTRH